MKWYRNLGISAKIFLFILVVLILVGSVAVFGIMSWSSSNAQNKALFDTYGNTQGYLGQVLAQYQQQRALLRDMAIVRDKRVAANIGELVKASDKLMMENLDLIKVASIDSEFKSLYDDLDSNIQAYREVRDQLAAAAVEGNFDSMVHWIEVDSDAHNALIKTTTDQKADAADSVSTATESEAAADAMSTATENEEASAEGADAVSSATISTGTTTAINNAIAFMVEHANELIRDQTNNVNSAILFIVAGIFVAVVVAVALGLFTSRNISRPLKIMTDVAMQVAAGNTDIKGLNYESKDEVGQMMASFRTMTESIRAMIMDVELLAHSALEGRLAIRADENKHQGDYKIIIKGINDTLNAVVDPINEAKNVLHELSEGHLDVEMSGHYKGDYAIVKNALNDTMGILRGYITETAYVLGELSKGDLTCTIQTDYRGDFIALKNSINGIIVSLNQIMSEISKAAGHVAGGTQAVSSSSHDISEGAISQAGSIQELTATMSLIAEQTRMNADNANQAYQISSVMRDGAQSGSEKMHQVQKAMSDINASSASITKIIKVIDDIAFQTNILALNAAVEAARAGAQGKGFGVVAEEVRNLAAKSASAAKETAKLIKESNGKTETGKKIADDAMMAFNSIVEEVGKTVKLVEEIAAASKQQSGAIDQVSIGINLMSDVVQTNSAFAEETAAAAHELSEQAEILNEMVDHFKLKHSVGNILTEDYKRGDTQLMSSEDSYQY